MTNERHEFPKLAFLPVAFAALMVILVKIGGFSILGHHHHRTHQDKPEFNTKQDVKRSKQTEGIAHNQKTTGIDTGTSVPKTSTLDGEIKSGHQSNKRYQKIYESVQGILSGPKITDWLLAAFTFLLFCTTVSLARRTKESTNAVRSSQRAWLKISANHLCSKTAISDAHIITAVRTKVSNVGNTPATHVSVRTECYFMNCGVPYMEARNNFINNTKRTASFLDGVAVFPNDDFETINITGYSPDGFRDAIREVGGIRKVNFSIFICVAYKIVGDEKLHFTLVDASMLNTPVNEISLSKEETIELTPNLFSGVVAD